MFVSKGPPRAGSAAATYSTRSGREASQLGAMPNASVVSSVTTRRKSRASCQPPRSTEAPVRLMSSMNSAPPLAGRGPLRAVDRRGRAQPAETPVHRLDRRANAGPAALRPADREAGLVQVAGGGSVGARGGSGSQAANGKRTNRGAFSPRSTGSIHALRSTRLAEPVSHSRPGGRSHREREAGSYNACLNIRMETSSRKMPKPIMGFLARGAVAREHSPRGESLKRHRTPDGTGRRRHAENSTSARRQEA